jgi:hypothetical protein
METHLRPLTLGEILDRTAQLYRTNFLLFAGIFAVYCGVALVFNLLLLGVGVVLKNMHYSAAKIVIINMIAGGIELLILFLLFGAAVAAISRAVAWVNLGEPATIRGAYASVLPRLKRYLWLMTLTAIIVWLPIVLLYGSYVGVMAIYIKGFGATGGMVARQTTANPQSMTILIGASVVFVLLLIPIGVYTVLMGLRYALALPSCVIENLPAHPSLRRSAELSKGSKGRIFVLWLLIGIIKIGLGVLPQMFFVVDAVKHQGQISPGMSALSQIIAFFTNTFLGPIYATGITLFYFDQRVRKEGFDIEWMMKAAGMTPPPPEIAAETSSAPLAMPEPLNESGSVHE